MFHLPLTPPIRERLLRQKTLHHDAVVVADDAAKERLLNFLRVWSWQTIQSICSVDQLLAGALGIRSSARLSLSWVMNAEFSRLMSA